MRRRYQFFVYIAANYDRSILYIGLTNSIIRRILEHKYGFGSYFTRRYKIKYLVYYESYGYINDAEAREKELKKWRRDKKFSLIKSQNYSMKDLSGGLIRDYGISKREIERIVRELNEKYKTRKQAL